MPVNGECHIGIDRRIINENAGNMQIYGQGHNCQITIVGPLIPRSRRGISLNRPRSVQNKGKFYAISANKKSEKRKETAIGSAKTAGPDQGSNNTAINNNTSLMTVVGQGTNCQVHLSPATAFPHDSRPQDTPPTLQSPHLINPNPRYQNSMPTTFNHLDAVSPNLSGGMTTPYPVKQTTNQLNAPVGPSSSLHPTLAGYHGNHKFMNTGTPSTTAADTRGMMSALCDPAGSSRVQMAQSRAPEPSQVQAALTSTSAPAPTPHSGALTLASTPLIPSQATGLSPAPTTVPAPPATQNLDLIIGSAPSTGQPPIIASDGRTPKSLLLLPTTPLPDHSTTTANSNRTRQGRQPSVSGASAVIRESAECYGTPPSAQPAPYPANTALSSPVAEIVQTFQPTLSPLLDMKTPSSTHSTSTEAAESLSITTQGTLARLNPSRLSIQPSQLSRASSTIGSNPSVNTDGRASAQILNQEIGTVVETSSRRGATHEEPPVINMAKKKKYGALVYWVLRQGGLVRHRNHI